MKLNLVFVGLLSSSSIFSQTSDTIKQKTIEEVTLVAKKPTVESKVDRTVFNVANSSILAGNTTWDVLRMTPLVSIDNNDNVKAEGEAVTVYINDRKTVFTGKELKEYLKAIPAENLMKVEVITSPSAKYESNGVVVNIVLKKREDEGIKGSVSFTNTQSAKNSQYSNFNVNYHKKNFTQTLSGGYNDNTNYSTSTNTNYYYDSKISNDINSENTYRGKMPSLSSTSELELNDKNNLGLILEFFQNKNSNNVLSQGSNYKDDVLTDSYERIRDASGLYRYLGSNLFYKFYDKEKNRILDINVGFNYNSDTNDSAYLETSSINLTPVLTGIKEDAASRNYYLKVDYSQPFGKDQKSTFEVGAKTNFNNNTIPNDLYGNNLNLNGIQSNDIFRYKDNLNMAYANINTKLFDKLETRIGLRYEYFDFEVTQDIAKTSKKDSYGTFLPNVLLKYNFTGNFNLSASYNRNIWRPWYTEFNPFLIPGEVAGFYERGNLDLLPNTSDRLSLKAGLYKKYFISLNYWVSNQDYWGTYVIEDGKTISMPVNFLGKSEKYSINFNTNQTFIQNKLSVNLNLGYNYIDNSDFNQRNKLNAKNYLNNFNGSTNISYTNLFGKNININTWLGVFTQNNGNSYGNKVNVFNNISITKIFDKLGMEASVKLNNIFKKPVFDATTYSEIGTFKTVNHMDWHGVSLSIVKRFGNQKVKENSKTDVEKDSGGGK